jgi:hypothetical protein
VTTATKQKTAKQERSAKLMQIGESLILWLTRGKDITAYRVEAIRHDFGRAAFILHKADKGTGEERKEYEVLLDGANSTCSCPGNTYHGHCVHVESLTALQNAGKLPQSETKLAESTVPVPEPEDEIDARLRKVFLTRGSKPAPTPEETETVEIGAEPPAPSDPADLNCDKCGQPHAEHISGHCNKRCFNCQRPCRDFYCDRCSEI